MPDDDANFSGSIPDLYDTYLVPLIFEEFAEDMAKRVADLQPQRIVEIAAGSGVVTRALAPKLTAKASYTVTDLNPDMLDHAARRQEKDGRIRWQQANALDLPFDEGSFDAACCQFGVMFFPDRVAGYREIRRVLVPGGHYIFNVWDDIGSNEFADIVTAAGTALFPENPPRFLARIPHGYHDLAVIERELSAAGLDMADAQTVDAYSTAPSPRHVSLAYCQGTPLREEIKARSPDGLDRVTDRVTEALAQKFGRGEITGGIRGHVITAVRPA